MTVSQTIIYETAIHETKNILKMTENISQNYLSELLSHISDNFTSCEKYINSWTATNK